MNLMTPVRKVLYAPPVNYLVRNLMKPFAPLLPGKYRLPVSGKVKFDIEPFGTLLMETNQTNVVTQRLFWGGLKGYEYAVVSVFAELVKDARVMLDCGANIGYLSLLAARINPEIRVYAFDPMPAAIYFMEKNIALNGLERNIELIPKAVGKSRGEAEFFVSKNSKAMWLEHHIGGSSTLSMPMDELSETITVSIETIDLFVEEHALPTVDLIKMDTEATEDQVIEGALKTLTKHKPIVICEIIPGRIEEKVEKLMGSLDFLAFFSDEMGLRRINKLSGFDSIENIFFVHKDKTDLIKPFVV